MAIGKCKAFLCIVYMLLVGQTFARQQDAVAMDVAGSQITAAEIQYAYQRHLEGDSLLSIQDFVEDYLDIQLKACYALRHRLDTLPEVRDEYAAFERSLLFETLVDSAFLDSLRGQPHVNQGWDVAYQEKYLIADIHIPVRQKCTDTSVATRKSDSIYQSLKQLTDGDRMLTCQADTLCVGQYDVLPSFYEHLKHMKEGVWNAPIAIEDGYHIVKVIRRMSTSSEFLAWKLSQRTSTEDNDRLLAFLEGCKKLSLHSTSSSLSLDTFRTVIAKVYPQTAFRLNECKTHLLAFEAVDYFKDSVSSVADGDVLSRHFKKNKKRFQWKEPRFKGVMVIAPNKHLADLAIKVVSRCRNEEAARIVLSRIYGADVTKTIAVCFGIFEKGDDDYIDKKVYGVSSSTESDELFHKAIKGKLCKRPASYSDDEEAVRQDYLARQETEWIRSLRKEYPYSIYWDTIIKNQ